MPTQESQHLTQSGISTLTEHIKELCNTTKSKSVILNSKWPTANKTQFALLLPVNQINIETNYSFKSIVFE